MTKKYNGHEIYAIENSFPHIEKTAHIIMLGIVFLALGDSACNPEVTSIIFIKYCTLE
jgi:hypothetical protein